MRHSVFARALLASSALGFSLTPALAAPDKATEPDTIVVTGSAIKTSPDAVAVPVTRISAADIAKAGVNSNVLDILRKSVPAFGGRSNQGASNGSNNNQRTAGGCSVQLRNLDTLVLVNGRRVAIDSIIGSSNGKPFVNICEIAPDAIERIEVLTDGASAIYGSDAIGGVVNIILKSDYQGASVNARYGGASGYNERSVGVTLGFNPLKHTNITLGASYSKTDPLYQNQRGFSSPFYSTNYGVPGSIGNFYLTPGVTTPALGTGAAGASTDPQYINAGAAVGTAINTGVTGTHDLSSYSTILLQEQQKAITLNLTSDLSGGAHQIELFGDFEYAQNDSFASYAPTVAGLAVPASSPVNPFTSAVTVNFGDSLAPVTFSNSEQSYRGTIGLKGKLDALGKGTDWEIGYTHSENELDELISNVLYRPNIVKLASGASAASSGAGCTAGNSLVLSAADGTSFVCQPTLNPFGVSSAVNPASFANVLTNETFHGKSKLDTFDVKLSGSPIQLPGGKIGYAIGGQWRREAVSSILSPNAFLHAGGNPANGLLGVNPVTGGVGVGLYNAVTNPTGGDVGALLTAQNGTSLTGDPFSASRTITSEFAEVRIPIFGASMNIPGFYNFDLIGAVRHEHYSDAGDSTVPKIGFRWQPVARQITIRGNYAKSFTAPTLYQLFQPINFRTVGTGPVNSALLGFSAPGSVSGFFGEDGNNPSAKPAHSESYSLGVVLKPDIIPRLTVDFEYSKTTETGQITGIGYNNVLADVNLNGSASQFFNNVAVGGYNNIGNTSANPFGTAGSLATYLKNATVANGGIDSNTGNYNLYVVDRPTNLGLIRVESLNVTTNYQLPTNNLGNISLTNQLAYLITYQYEAVPGNSAANPATLIYNFAGTTTQGGGAQGTLPRLRMYTSLDWDYNQWSFGIANTYIGPVADIGAGGAGFYGSATVPAGGSGYLAGKPGFVVGHVNSFSSWDLRTSWSSTKEKGHSGVTISAGVNNLFNTQPPLSTNISPTAGASNASTAWRLENNTDTGTYISGAIGRLIWVSAGFKF